MEGGVPSEGNDAGRAGLIRQEGSVQSAWYEGPQGAAEAGVVRQDAAYIDGSLRDDGGELDDAIIVGVILRAHDGGDEGNVGQYVWQAGGVVLDASAERGEVGEGGLAPIEEAFEEGGQASDFLGRHGERAQERVHYHAGVGRVPVGEEVRAGPSIEGGAWFFRVSGRLRDICDSSSELVLGLEAMSEWTRGP